MDKKLYIIFILIALVAVTIVYLVSIPPAVVYSDDPATWIEAKPDGKNMVSVDKVTQGEGEFEDSKTVLEDVIAINYDGLYDGEYFRGTRYFDDDGNVLLRITDEMVPNDGILDGIILEREEGESLKAFIFVDEDWKTEFGNLNIAWGRSYEHFKEYQFNEVSPGVYMDSIDDDKNRFEYDYRISYGGIAVGDFTQEDVSEWNEEGLTVMRSY